MIETISNSNYLLEQEAAVKINRLEDLPSRLGTLLGSGKLRIMASRAKALGKPQAAMAVCRVVGKKLAAILGALILLGGSSRAVTTLKKGEDVQFFPDYAWLSPDGMHWTALVHGWDYRLELDSKRRDWLARVLGRSLGLSKEDIASPDFKRRALWFLAKNVHGRQVQVKVAGHWMLLKPTGTSGHIHDQIAIPHPPNQSTGNAWMRLTTNLATSDGDPVTLSIRRLGPEGMIVVADIDDAIKVTGVGRRREMLDNTFVKPYVPVGGMPELLQRWATSFPNVAFFYISASPWPLYNDFTTFLKQASFPRGILKLKHFRWGDQSFFSLWQNPVRYKTPILEELFQRFPKRHFVLVGDTGEKDPEIYGDLARRHPDQISDIYIHELSDIPPQRYQVAFKGVDSIRWHTFKTVHDLGM